MARPTGTQLTGAGFAQVGSTNVYTKSTGTAKCVVDITGNAGQGSIQVVPATDTYFARSDFLGHVSTLNGLGMGLPSMPNTEGETMTYYGQTL